MDNYNIYNNSVNHHVYNEDYINNINNINNINDLQQAINILYLPKTCISLEHYHTILRQCVMANEFAATVFVYDHLANSCFTATDKTFKIIEPLHSKTLPENKKLELKAELKKQLAPRRRIHKIMKGYYYSTNYENAKIYVPKVKAFLSINKEFKDQPRIKLAKTISKGCNISFNEARYLITSLKREGYLKPTDQNLANDKIGKTKTLDKFFKITVR